MKLIKMALEYLGFQDSTPVLLENREVRLFREWSVSVPSIYKRFLAEVCAFCFSRYAVYCK